MDLFKQLESNINFNKFFSSTQTCQMLAALDELFHIEVVKSQEINEL